MTKNPARLTGYKVLLIGAEPLTLLSFRGPLIRQLLEEGCDVHLAAGPPSDDVLKRIMAEGVRFHALPLARAGMNPLSDVRTMKAIFSLIRQITPHCVIAYTAKPVVYGLLAAWLAGVPRRVAMITGLGYAFIAGPEFKRKLARLAASALYGMVLPRCTRVIFQNPDDLEEFRRRRLLPENVAVAVVNGSGVDLLHFPVHPPPEGPPAFVMIARLLVDKGTREYVGAAGMVKKQIPNVRFVLVGGPDPSPNGIAPEEIRSWQSQGIEYLGELKDVRPAIQSAAVVVLPSYREGTPRSVLEGMAMGRAIITTDAPGCRETVVPGINGLLVPPRNAEALASAMLQLACDPALVAAMGMQSRRLAAERYEAKAVALDTLQKAGILPDP